MVGTTVHSATRYTVQDLGTFWPRDTNIHQDLVGEQEGGALVCLAGHDCLNLGLGRAEGINESRQVVGSGAQGGWVWHPDTGLQLLPTGPDLVAVEPFAISEPGVIVGRGY